MTEELLFDNFPITSYDGRAALATISEHLLRRKSCYSIIFRAPLTTEVLLFHNFQKLASLSQAFHCCSALPPAPSPPAPSTTSPLPQFPGPTWLTFITWLFYDKCRIFIKIYTKIIFSKIHFRTFSFVCKIITKS